jgi:hypothetical protein
MKLLVDAAKLALDHVRELRDAWASGALTCRDSSARANRNVDVEVALRDAIHAAATCALSDELLKYPFVVAVIQTEMTIAVYHDARRRPKELTKYVNEGWQGFRVEAVRADSAPD